MNVYSNTFYKLNFQKTFFCMVKYTQIKNLQVDVRFGLGERFLVKKKKKKTGAQ